MQDGELFGSPGPPDTHKSIKLSLDKLLLDNKKNQTYPIIFDAVKRMNEITLHTYQLLRLYILHQYHRRLNIPEIDKKFIKTCFKVVLKNSAGPINKHENYGKINTFFKRKYVPLIEKIDESYDSKKYFEKLEAIKFNGLNLSQIISYQSTDMVTNINNNIQINFTKYLKRFITRSILKEVYNYTGNHDVIVIYNELLKNKEITDQKKMEYKKIIYRLHKDDKKMYKIASTNAYSIMDSILDGKYTCLPIFNNWIKRYRSKILPKFKHSYEDELKHNPQIFLKHMIYMNRKLEKNGYGLYQFFPIRRSFIPKYITLDTKALIELFTEKNKNKYLSDIEGCKEHIWSSIINRKHNIFKPTKEIPSDYIFNYMIATDGVSVSVIMVHKDQYQKDLQQKLNKKNGKLKMVGMTPEEKEIYKKKRDEDNLLKKNLMREEKDKIRQANKQKTLEFKKSLKGLSVKERKEKQEERKKYLLSQKKVTGLPHVEFPYIDENLSEEQIAYINSCKKVYVDPGKIRLLTMVDDENKYLKYNNKEHVYKTKRLQYQSELNKHKMKHGITEIENELSKVNSFTCSYSKFKEYIKLKTKVYNELSQKYADLKFRKYRWYGFINRRRTEDNLLNTISKKYGNNKNIILIMGDWRSSETMRGTISTPNIRLKRKLAQRFKVFNLDEFRTSCLSYKTEDYCNNLKIIDENGITRKIHSVLTYKMENNRYGCINRDKNAVNNMKKIVDSYLLQKERPLRYRRGYELKDANLCKKDVNTSKSLPRQLAS